MRSANPTRDGPHHSMIYDVVFFVALLATALALGGALELPNKIGLSRDEYFIVQQSYRGWNRLAYLLAVELISMIALAAMSRNEPHVFWPTIIAILCLVAAQVVF